MHTIKISFEGIENKNFDDVNQSVSLLIGVRHMNGQIAGKEFPIARTKRGMEIYVDAPDSDSLSKKLWAVPDS